MKSFLVAVALAVVFTATAQPVPHIGFVYPAGGRQGATFHVTVGGQNLANVTNAILSGSGIKADIVEYNRPMPQGEFNNLRDELKVLQERRAAFFRDNRKRNGPGAQVTSTNTWTNADENRAAEIRAKIIKNPPNRQGNPAIAETVTLNITIAPDAAPGDREIRLATQAGLANPMRFCVGQLAEFSKPLVRASNPDLDRFLERLGRPSSVSNRYDAAITLPATVNGQIPPGGVDRYRFHVREGQQIVVVARARELIPYLADAVPGWFQATLTILDSKGREVAYNDDFRFHPDPVLRFVAPHSGDYFVVIKDSIYRGREDFVYRITLGELPFLTGIFPLGGPLGRQTTVQLSGWNLPTNTITVDATNAVNGVQLVRVEKDGHWSNLVPFAAGTLPERTGTEPDNDRKHAQIITLPVVINGRIDAPGDTDFFQFQGRAGDEIVAEVHARRLDSPLDSVLRLLDSEGRQLACNDDNEDKGSGLNTHHADSYLRVKLTADGLYFIQISDTQGKGGPEYAYRLQIGAPQPDFELRVVPSSLGVRGNGSVPLTVYVLRRDGFTNAIKLSLKDAPAGFKLSGAQVTTNQDQLRFTLTAPAITTNALFDLAIEGHATIDGREVVHEAVPADDMMQAFAYRHLVPAQTLTVAVAGRLAQRVEPRILSSTPVKIPAGSTASVHVSIPANPAAGRLHFELNAPPDGISIKSFGPAAGRGMEIILESDAQKVQAGQKGNLIINAFAARNEEPGGNKPKAAQRRAPLFTLPAIPFEILPRQETDLK
jgi:hypothetical protein